MVRLAFYKGRGGFIDWVIRWATRSPYSHVELVDEMGVWWTSSHRDRGVRAKMISPNPDDWDYLEVPSPEHIDWDVFSRAKGAKYDYLGILLSQMLSLSRHSKTRWFCSEICGEAMGFAQPQTLSPGSLYHQVAWFHRFLEEADA